MAERLHFGHNRMSLLFIVGPTASGKTELALCEAERRGAVILSCDSLCVYRGMDIGTAKPTPAQRQRVPHYGLDLAEPDEPYSVDRYIRYRDHVLARCREAGVPVVVVGGSGFYLRSFFFPVTDTVEVPEALAREVAALREAEGLPGLVRALRACHGPEETFAGLDLANPRRVEKALLRCRATGRSYSELLRAFKALPPPLPDWDKEVWLVSHPPGALAERIRARTGRMLADGLVEEVRALRARGFERNPSAAGAIGYREALAFLDGRLPESELAATIAAHTRQLAHKQRTWFRHQIPVDRQVAGLPSD